MRRVIPCVIVLILLSFGVSVYAVDSVADSNPSSTDGLFVVQESADEPFREYTDGKNKCTLYLNDDGLTYSAVYSGEGTLDDVIHNHDINVRITKLTIEDGFTEIGKYAFSWYLRIKEVEIPDSVTCIDGYAFEHCDKLESVKLPKHLERIGTHAFVTCDSLTSIDIPEGITEIESCAFDECHNLTDVKLPSTLEVIREYAFASAVVDELEFPEGLKRIERNAFTSIRKVTVPSSLEYMGENCFGYGVRSLYINDYNSWLRAEREVELYNPLASVGSVYINGGQPIDIQVEEGITHIPSYAFAYCKDIRSVTLPDSVISIGKQAFAECTGIECVDAPSIEQWLTLSMADDSANPLYSNECAILTVCGGQLRDVEIPEGVTAVPAYTFRGWNLLKAITYSSTVKSVGRDAYAGCTGLETIRIDDVNHWLKLSVGNKFSIPTVYGNAQIYTGTAGDYKPVRDVVVDSSVKLIQACAFNGCETLESITLSNSVLTIGSNSFAGCGSLRQVVIPDRTTVINDGAFKDCTSLESIMIPETVSRVGRNVFFGCNEELVVYGVNGSAAQIASERDGVNFQELASVSGTVGDEIQWKLVGHTLIVSGTGRIPDCTDDISIIPELSEEVRKSITSIRIEGIRAIGANALEGFSSIRNIIFDKTAQIEEIAEDAFGDISFAEVTYCESTPYIEKRLRELYPKFSYVVIRDGRSSNLEWVYNSKSKMLIIGCNGANATDCNVEESPFKDYKVNTVNFREDFTCRDIPANLFKGCTSVTEINIPPSIEEIGEGAFEDCRMLKVVSWHDGIKRIGARAFKGCSELSVIELMGNEILDEDGITNEDAICEIPDGVSAIGDSTFENCSAIQNIIIEGKLYSIGSNSFRNCRNLTRFDIADAPAVIGNSAFCGCSKLGSEDGNSIVLEGTKSIGDDAFLNCPYIHTAYVDGGLQEIGEHAMGYECSGGIYNRNDSFEVLASSISQAVKSYCGEEIPVRIDDNVYGNSDTYVSLGCSRLTLKRNKSANVRFRTNGTVSRITYTKSGTGGVTVLPHKHSVTFRARGNAGQCTVRLNFKMKGQKTIVKTVYVTSKGGTSSVEDESEIQDEPVPAVPVVKPMPKRVTAKARKLGRKKAVVSWTKIPGVSGYQIQVATNKKFRKARKYYVSGSARRRTVRIIKGKTNYIRIRYRYAGKYSSWSKRITLRK